MTKGLPFQKEWKMSSQYGCEKKLIDDLIPILMERYNNSDHLEEIKTAVGEACLNAIEHGNGLQSDRIVVVHMNIAGNKCIFRIYDEGKGFDDSAITAIQENHNHKENPRGWGLLFMNSFADRISVGHESEKFFVELEFLLVRSH